MWIDTHCHLDMLSTKQFVTSNSLSAYITIATDLTSCKNVLDQVATHDPVFGTLGVHPHEAQHWTDSTAQFIEEQAKQNKKIIGIGECGFDFYYEHSAAKPQEQALIAQINIATQLDLPLVIHCRDAQQMMEKVLTQYTNTNLNAVFHSFTGSKEFARELLNKGFYISFNGIVTFKNANDLRELLRFVPLDRILLETDSPFLAPHPLRGKENKPENTAIIGNYVASFLQISEEELATHVKQNTIKLFPRIKNYLAS